MARILCGVMGDAMGHVGQARALAQALPGHEFLFAGGGRAAWLAGLGHGVVPLPVPATLYRRNRVDLAATLGNGAKVLAGLGPAIARLRAVMREFRPDLVLSLYELCTPLAARGLGLACHSLDHQHLFTRCRSLGIPGQGAGRLLLTASLGALFSWSSHYLVHSFFAARPRDPGRTRVFPPLLSPNLRGLRPDQGEYVLVYQTSATFKGLLPALEKWGRPCLVYGLGRRPSRGNLQYRDYDQEAFLADLAGCRFLVANGGHSAISEALFLGKPVLSFPIALAYEQYANAYMLARLGYGDFSLDTAPGPEIFRRFESRLAGFRAALANACFWGTETLAARLEVIMRNSPLERGPWPGAPGSPR